MKRFINVTRAKTIVFALGFSALTATAAESGQQTPIASTDATNNPLDASAAVAANSSIDPTKKLIRGVFLQAQTETGQNPPGVASVSVRPPADIPPPTRKGPLSELGDELEKQGFTFGLFFTNGYFTNPTAGIKPGSSMDSPGIVHVGQRRSDQAPRGSQYTTAHHGGVGAAVSKQRRLLL